MSGTWMPNMKLTGQSFVSGGQYDAVRIMGEAVIQGDTACRSLTCTGTAEWNGSLSAERMRITGTAKTHGNLRCRTLRAAGEIGADGTVQAGKLRISGLLRAGEGCEAERLLVNGVSVQGLLNAGVFKLRLGGPSDAGEIGGDTIIVKPASFIWLKAFFRHTDTVRLAADLIEGDTVRLEQTEAGIVRGNHVTIGSGCVIERLEYRQSVTIHPKAAVGEQIRLQ